jgi:tetratricopeptide (TPR) repeat protein
LSVGVSISVGPCSCQFEPVNADYFEVIGCTERLRKTLPFLGIFHLTFLAVLVRLAKLRKKGQVAMRKSFLIVGPVLILAALTGRGYLGVIRESPQHRFGRAEVLYHQGKLDSAIVEMERALRDDPRQVEIRDALGTLYQLQGRMDDEIKVYEQGIRLMPNDPRMYYALGTALYSGKRYDDASVQVRKCLSINPHEPQYMHLLGMCYERSGKLAEAYAFWNANAHEHSQDEVIQRGLRRIQRKLATNQVAGIKASPNQTIGRSGPSSKLLHEKDSERP